MIEANNFFFEMRIRIIVYLPKAAAAKDFGVKCQVKSQTNVEEAGNRWEGGACNPTRG